MGICDEWQREEWMNSGWVENNSDWKSDGVGDDDKPIK
jgi:hypothetical protein